jgi:hypothetical protein
MLVQPRLEHSIGLSISVLRVKNVEEEFKMKKILIAGACLFALSSVTAMAAGGDVGGAPSTVSGGGTPGVKNNDNPSATTTKMSGASAKHMKKKKKM